jgi:hypothetical protein
MLLYGENADIIKTAAANKRAKGGQHGYQE